MNNQEFFDKTLAHLRKQGRPAWHPEHTQCMYRAPTDDRGVLMCAIGVHIPDEVYDPTMEGKTIEILFNGSSAIRSLFEGVDTQLLYNMQRLHDDLPVGRWRNFQAALEANAAELARYWNLNYIAPEASHG